MISDSLTESSAPVCAPLLSFYTTVNTAINCVSTFSLTTTSCPQKVNKSCTSVVCLNIKGCCNGCFNHIFIDHYFLFTRLINPAPLFRHHWMLQSLFIDHYFLSARLIYPAPLIRHHWMLQSLFIDHYFLSAKGQ